MRAAVEGVALHLSTVVDSLSAVAPVREVRATGGVLRSPLWRQVVAAVLGRPVTVTDTAEGTALGAAALGLRAVGRAESLEQARGLLLGSVDDEVQRPDPQAQETYRRVRASLPALLAGYEPAARMLSSGAAGAAPPTPRR